MPAARYVMTGAVLVLLTAAPIVVGPAATASADAIQAATERQARRWTPGRGDADARGVAQSNENERRDREERRGRNQNDSDDNDDGEDWEPPARPPRPVAAPAPPPDRVGACLSAGNAVALDGPDGTVAVTVFQGGVQAEVAWVDPSSVVAPPGGVLGRLAFRLAAGPCGGDRWSVFPNEVNVGVRYGDRLAAGRDEAAFALARLDGQAWVPVEKGAADPPNNYVSASVGVGGVYALVQR